MNKETVSIRIFGRDMTFSVSPKEKNDLIKSAEILNTELENISDKIESVENKCTAKLLKLIKFFLTYLKIN